MNVHSSHDPAQPVATFRLAINDRRPSPLGVLPFECSFVAVSASGEAAEAMAHARKGASVIVQGRLKEETDQTPEGANRTKLVVVAERVRVVPPIPPSRQRGSRDPARGRPTRAFLEAIDGDNILR